MWEMLYRCITKEYQRPYAEYTFITQPIQIVIQAAQKGLRPTIPNMERCPESFVQILRACWDTDPANRPDTSKLIELLEECKNGYTEDKEYWDACLLRSKGSLQTSSQFQTPPEEFSPINL
jgi:hypothetical protein